MDAPSAPTPDDLTALGYSRGIAVAAIAFLLAEKAAGRLRCYTYLARGGEWGWYVTDETIIGEAKPSEYRRELGDWAHDWIMGRAFGIDHEAGLPVRLPGSPRSPEGGAA